MAQLQLTRFEEVALANLLGQRYGDGLVYLQSHADRLLLKLAGRLGLVCEQGYLTADGKRFWQQRVERVSSMSRMRHEWAPQPS
jgi:hypothetical protein